MAQDDFVRARESMLWRWRPHSCSLFDFRPISSQRHTLGALLRKLGPRKVILVGDSLILEQYISLEVRPDFRFNSAKQMRIGETFENEFWV